MKSTQNSQQISNTAPKCSSTLVEQLKEKGLYLTEDVIINLPQVHSPKPTLMSQIFSLLSNQQTQWNLSTPKKVDIVHTNFIVITQCNTVSFYSYFLTIEDLISLKYEKHFHLSEYVRSIVIPQEDHIVDNDYFYLAILYKQSKKITLIGISKKNHKIQLINDVYLPNKIIQMEFVCRQQLVIIFDNNQLTYYELKDNTLKLKCHLKCQIGNHWKPGYLKILPYVREQQQSLITIFECGWQQISSSIQIRIHEIIRSFNGNVRIHPVIHEISCGQHSQTFLQKIRINNFHQSFLLSIHHEVFLIKKKFNKYHIIDAITQTKKLQYFKIIIKKIPFICSIIDQNAELWAVEIKENKFACKLIDVIKIDKKQQFITKLISLWIFDFQNRSELGFISDAGQRQVVFCGVEKVDKLKKLVKSVKSIDKCEVEKVQQLGTILGIDRRQFYLKLWTDNCKDANNIYQYLLPCNDLSAIRYELQIYMRKKTIFIWQLIKILEEIEKILMEQLNENLNLETLKWLLKNNFQMRKLKMYEVDQTIDYQQFLQIYQSSIYALIHQIIDKKLYPPAKTETDPIWDMKPKKDHKLNIKHILQQFRLILLINYDQFLLKLLQKYKTDLTKVLKKYHYLLPMYPFEMQIIRKEVLAINQSKYLNQTLSQKQYMWFSDIKKKNQLDKQAMSYHNIFQNLYPHYATNKIATELEKLINHSWFQKRKMIKHSMITFNDKQLHEKIKFISGEYLYIRICQFANEVALQFKKPSEAPALLTIFKQRNGLIGQVYQNCLLYARIHEMMLISEIITINTTIEDLIKMKTSHLISLFFLGNRQKNQYLLTEFKQIYTSRKLFMMHLEEYVFSESCSKIELQLILREVTQLGQEFQITNQDILTLIINGFTSRIELRDFISVKVFFQLLDNIKLNIEQVHIVTKMMNVKNDVYKIFQLFECEEMTYEQILSNPIEVMNKIMENFFKNNMRSQTICLEDEEICLQVCRNTFSIILYLKQKLYQQIDQLQYSLAYGEILLDWKQYEIIMEIFYDEDTMQNAQFDTRDFINELIIRVLNKLYKDEDVIYNEQTHHHINEILNLDINCQDNPIAIRQQAKLDILEIISQWNVVVRIQYVELMCIQWEECDRKQLISEIFDNYIKYLNLEQLRNLYRAFELTQKQQQQYIDDKSDQLIDFALDLAERLMVLKKYEQVTKIIYFINQGEVYYRAQYSLMTQCFTKSIFSWLKVETVQNNLKVQPTIRKLQKKLSLMSHFPQQSDSNFKQIKLYIEYYTLKWKQVSSINQIFKENFISSNQLDLISQYDQILIDRQLCFKYDKVCIQLSTLWQIAGKVGKKDVITALKIYFFLLMGLQYPKIGFHQLNKIDYNYIMNVESLNRLNELSRRALKLSGLNMELVYREYFRGMITTLLSKVDPQFDPNSIKKMQENHIRQFVDKIKKSSNLYTQLIRAIKKIEHLIHLYRQESLHRLKRYQQQTPDTQIISLAHPQADYQSQHESSQFNVMNLTMTLHEFKEKKKQIKVLELSDAFMVSKIFQNLSTERRMKQSQIIDKQMETNKIVDHRQCTKSETQELENNTVINELRNLKSKSFHRLSSLNQNSKGKGITSQLLLFSKPTETRSILGQEKTYQDFHVQHDLLQSSIRKKTQESVKNQLQIFSDHNLMRISEENHSFGINANLQKDLSSDEKTMKEFLHNRNFDRIISLYPRKERLQILQKLLLNVKEWKFNEIVQILDKLCIANRKKVTCFQSIYQVFNTNDELNPIDEELKQLFDAKYIGSHVKFSEDACLKEIIVLFRSIAVGMPLFKLQRLIGVIFYVVKYIKSMNDQFYLKLGHGQDQELNKEKIRNTIYATILQQYQKESQVSFQNLRIFEEIIKSAPNEFYELQQTKILTDQTKYSENMGKIIAEKMAQMKINMQ